MRRNCVNLLLMCGVAGLTAGCANPGNVRQAPPRPVKESADRPTPIVSERAVGRPGEDGNWQGISDAKPRRKSQPPQRRQPEVDPSIDYVAAAMAQLDKLDPRDVDTDLRAQLRREMVALPPAQQKLMAQNIKAIALFRMKTGRDRAERRDDGRLRPASAQLPIEGDRYAELPRIESGRYGRPVDDTPRRSDPPRRRPDRWRPEPGQDPGGPLTIENPYARESRRRYEDDRRSGDLYEPEGRGTLRPARHLPYGEEDPYRRRSPRLDDRRADEPRRPRHSDETPERPVPLDDRHPPLKRIADDRPADDGQQAATDETPGEQESPDEEPAEERSWKEQLAGAIKALEAEVREGTGDDHLQRRREIFLRLLYLVAQRRSDAVKEIAKLPETEQAFWRQALYALDTQIDTQRRYVDGDGITLADKRAAAALAHLHEAVGHLADTSRLHVRNLRFCTEVLSYGKFTEFDSTNFKPGQEVLLYCEIENFTSEKLSAGKGYETTLVASYTILDGQGAGRPVAKYTFPTETDRCDSRRRDFFIPFHITLPESVSPGKYRLQLLVEDTKGRKFGQSWIDFTIER